MRIRRAVLVACTSSVSFGGAGCAGQNATAQIVPASSTAASMSSQVPSPLRDALQLVVFTSSDWSATTGTLHRFERESTRSPWTIAASAIPAVIGRTGLAWADPALASSMGQPVKHEGDGKSPAGAFPLDTAFGFAPRTEMQWLRLPYSPLVAGSDCVDDEVSVHYNTVVDRAAVTKVDWTSAEHMRSINQYRIGVIVGYNAAPPTPGRGSCIFLHIW